MAVSLINIGTIANDGTGDDLREAFIKVNSNFEELDLRQPEQTTASNLGEAGQGLFSQKVGYDLQFKKIVAGDNITLTSSANGITVTALGGLQSINVIADAGGIILSDGDTLRIQGGNYVTTRVDAQNNKVLIDGQGPLVTEPNPTLSAELQGAGNNLVNIGTIDAGNITSTNFLGPLDGLVYGKDIRLISKYFDDIDFGGFTENITNWIDYLISQTDIDLGTFVAPGDETFDLGTLV